MTTIQIDAPDGPIDALLSVPQGQGPWPGVVVIHDAIGYGRDKESINDRIARAGYVALTPNLYARGGRIRCITRVMRELAAQRCAAAGLTLRIPKPRLCTDNGAMIASFSAHLVAAGAPPSPLDLPSDPGLTTKSAAPG